MIKKLLSIVITIIVLGLIVFKVIFVWNIDTVESDENYEDISNVNCCIALDYHRIREGNLWNRIIESVIKPDELTNYSIYKEEFEEHIDRLIEEGAYFATLDEIESFRKNGNFPDKCVWICLDDADHTLYKNAYPILKEKNIPFTVFVIAGQVGNKDFSNLSLCTWDELREMRDSGLASFGSHTYNMHYFEDDGATFLSKDIHEEFYEDIKKSREVLEEELNTKITSIAYPFGESSDTLAELSKKAGFQNGFILASYAITPENDDYYQNRYMINRNNFNKIMDVWLN